MNAGNSMALRARIKTLSKDKGISPQLALQSFFAERFLARIEKSRYSRNLALKGGTLMGAIFGIEQRTTMDIDATVVGIRADEAKIVAMVDAIASTDTGDGILFLRNDSRPSAIAKDDEYGGYTIGLTATFGTIRLPIDIDVTFGDVITPQPRLIEFKSIVEETVTIRLLAYTMETLIAEKLQTILKRGVGTTRPRDFYDLHKIYKRGDYDRHILPKAIWATFENRASMEILGNWHEIVEAIKASDFQRQQWERYRKKAPYAANVTFNEVIGSLIGILSAITT